MRASANGMTNLLLALEPEGASTFELPTPGHGIEPVLKDEAAMDRGRLTDQARAQMATPATQTPSRMITVIGARQWTIPTVDIRVDGRVDIRLDKKGAQCGLGRGIA